MFEVLLATSTGSDGFEPRFILNGLRNANKVLGETVFVEKDWRVIGEYVYDVEGGRHQAFYAPKRDIVVMGQLIRTHERIQVEQSLKYSKAEAEELWKRAGMEAIGQWRHRAEYGEWLYYVLPHPKTWACHTSFPDTPRLFCGTWGHSDGACV